MNETKSGKNSNTSNKVTMTLVLSCITFFLSVTFGALRLKPILL